MAFRRDGTADLDEDRDFLRQQIKKLAAMLARLVAGVRGAGEADVALAEARRSVDELLGAPTEMLDRLDVASVASMLRDDHRLGIYAALCAARVQLVQRAAVTEPDQDGQRGRAVAIYRLLLARSPDDEATLEALRALETGA